MAIILCQKWRPRSCKNHDDFYVLDCLLLIHGRGKTTQDIHARARFYEWKFSPNFLRPFCEWKTTGKSSRNPLGVSNSDWSVLLKLHPWLLCFKLSADLIGLKTKLRIHS